MATHFFPIQSTLFVQQLNVPERLEPSVWVSNVFLQILQGQIGDREPELLKQIRTTYQNSWSLRDNLSSLNPESVDKISQFFPDGLLELLMQISKSRSWNSFTIHKIRLFASRCMRDDQVFTGQILFDAIKLIPESSLLAERIAAEEDYKTLQGLGSGWRRFENFLINTGKHVLDWKTLIPMAAGAATYNLTRFHMLKRLNKTTGALSYGWKASFVAGGVSLLAEASVVSGLSMGLYRFVDHREDAFEGAHKTWFHSLASVGLFRGASFMTSLGLKRLTSSARVFSDASLLKPVSPWLAVPSIQFSQLGALASIHGLEQALGWSPYTSSGDFWADVLGQHIQLNLAGALVHKFMGKKRRITWGEMSNQMGLYRYGIHHERFFQRGVPVFRFTNLDLAKIEGPIEKLASNQKGLLIAYRSAAKQLFAALETENVEEILKVYKTYEPACDRVLSEVRGDQNHSQASSEIRASILHDLGNVINGLSGAATIYSFYPERAADLFSMVKPNFPILEQLLALLLSEPISGAQKVDWKKLLHDEVQQAEYKPYGRPVDFDITLLSDHVEGYSALLKLLIKNLRDNSSKYSDPEQELRIRIRYEAPRFIFEDNASGIVNRHIPSLFDFASRAGRTDQLGTGVGTYLIAKMVQVQGGEIKLTSIPQVGTRYQIHIPEAKNQGGVLNL